MNNNLILIVIPLVFSFYHGYRALWVTKNYLKGKRLVELDKPTHTKKEYRDSQNTLRKWRTKLFIYAITSLLLFLFSLWQFLK